MKKTLAITLFFLLTSTTASAYTFTTKMKVGSRGEEVKNLQILLNQDPVTQVSETGAGSPGNETTYFGPATHRAVINFQN
ncbi:MAG: peptidoglycan-binding domain-containing protein, partial [Minisyncoccia bacterium]